ncbi:hypothetical protein BAZMOX_276927_0 [methanotrophic endosymbiont of Bathymodiolus azoricus (Menez Gwen)]|nr:hypothetical protein BAZMOX_276927_0 [methanotrophic endosymbiont of Bathymodiolus azoricus (Menez Gwen)]
MLLGRLPAPPCRLPSGFPGHPDPTFPCCTTGVRRPVAM